MPTNRLANETSPYLLQHAHNPVDWYPWGNEAIQRAKEEDKPILVSIGYSACHWCHVMEKESFEDPETAALMNRHFINIKIDREERPDLDQIYMDAVQAIAGNGGWPLNVFLTPEGKPFFGGTYFPPVNLQSRPSWKSVLLGISNAFQQKRTEINDQADQLTKHIARSDFGININEEGSQFTKEDINNIFDKLMRTADQVDGGFGQAPKFPQTFSIRFLLQHYYYTGKAEALNHALLSLDKMINGGIYDQLGGGFARYSTDALWLAPHFEKMLYDNALLITAMSEAFQLTGKEIYSKAICETMDFLQRELMSENGGFFSALDADSDGEEGRFYVWSKNEITELLGSDSAEFSTYYEVSEKGNWEGKNILRIQNPAMKIPLEKELEWKEKLMARRATRTRPGLDNKILLGWNALMITACCKAYAALGMGEYRDLAIHTMDFLEKNMKGDHDSPYFHSYKTKYGNTSPAESRISGRKQMEVREFGIPAFLDDYAYLIEAYIQMQEITGEVTYLIRAKELSEYVIANFSEDHTGYFYYTHARQEDVIVRKREIYDGATPSGNSVMAGNLLYLGTVFDLQEWKTRAINNVTGLKDLVYRHPGSFGVWATLINGVTYQLNEIVLSGSRNEKKHMDFLKMGIPNRVFQITSVTHPDLPLLRNKPVDGTSQFFLCRDYSCQQPVKEVAELADLIKNS
jgi:uncharacterized protein